MTNAFDPNLWQELEDDPVSGGMVRRRVVPSSPHNIFIGELRPSRERVLILEIKARHVRIPPRQPSSKGLNITIVSGDKGLVKVQLTSTSRADAPLFERLADDIVSVLVSEQGDSAAPRVLDRVLAWQLFFAAKKDGFSLQRAAGLFSELYILRERFLPAIGPLHSVDAWCGPDPAVQDFQVGGIAVEVKSFRGAGPGRMIISSERQLELTGVERLYLAYVRLDQRQDGSGSTLLQSINDVRTSVSGSTPAADILERRLLSYGWHDSYAEAHTQKYEVRASELFAVQADFPRITSDSLPNGVGGVSYSVDRSAISAFLVPWANLADDLGARR